MGYTIKSNIAVGYVITNKVLKEKAFQALYNDLTYELEDYFHPVDYNDENSDIIIGKILVSSSNFNSIQEFNLTELMPSKRVQDKIKELYKKYIYLGIGKIPEPHFINFTQVI